MTTSGRAVIPPALFFMRHTLLIVSVSDYRQRLYWESQLPHHRHTRGGYSKQDLLTNGNANLSHKPGHIRHTHRGHRPPQELPSQPRSRGCECHLSPAALRWQTMTTTTMTDICAHTQNPAPATSPVKLLATLKQRSLKVKISMFSEAYL